MRTFKDASGREWRLAITIGAIKRVRTLLGIDLLALHEGDPSPYSRLHLDPMTLVDVVYVLVKPQADADSVSDEQFGEAMTGEAVLAAYTGFMEELIDFFRLANRGDLAKIAEVYRDLIANRVNRAAQRAGKLAEEMATEKESPEEQAAQSDGRGNGQMSTDSPELSASTPIA